MGDVFCQVRCIPLSGSRCGDKDLAEFMENQSGGAPECCTPAPMLVWEATCTDVLGVNETIGSSPHRRALVLPGAWAMGEGVLFELDEPSEHTSPTSSSGSPDSLHRSFSRMADSFTAAMGSYLTNLANALTGCTNSVNTKDMSGRSAGPTQSHGLQTSPSTTCSGVHPAKLTISNKKTD